MVRKKVPESMRGKIMATEDSAMVEVMKAEREKRFDDIPLEPDPLPETGPDESETAAGCEHAQSINYNYKELNEQLRRQIREKDYKIEKLDEELAFCNDTIVRLSCIIANLEKESKMLSKVAYFRL